MRARFLILIAVTIMTAACFAEPGNDATNCETGSSGCECYGNDTCNTGLGG